MDDNNSQPKASRVGHMKWASRAVSTSLFGMCLLPFLLMAQQNDGAWTNIGRPKGRSKGRRI